MSSMRNIDWIEPVEFDYKNHRGEIERRRIVPESLELSFSYHGAEGDPNGISYHPQPGWVLNGWDMDREARRSFLLCNIVLPLDDSLQTEGGRKLSRYGGLSILFKKAK
jgi:hypothetical protein